MLRFLCIQLAAKCLLGQRGKLPELGFTRSIGDLMSLGCSRGGSFADDPLTIMENELNQIENQQNMKWKQLRYSGFRMRPQDWQL